MKITTVLLPILLLITSCASILNSHFASVEVKTTSPAKVIVEQDTLMTTNQSVNLAFERQKEPVEITIQTDSTSKTIRLEPKNSLAFWLNIPYGYGIGFIKDWNDPKRWTYHKRIYVDTGNSKPEFFQYSYFRKKGDLYWTISLPYVNNFYLKPEGQGTQQSSGFLGIGTGLEYYYHPRRFVSLNFQAAVDFPIFVPAPIDYFGTYESFTSSYFSLAHQHRINRFTFGYGLSYARNRWAYFADNELEPGLPSIRKITYATGAVFPASVQLGELFYFGLTYRPTIYRANADPKFQYEHLLSLDFAWKLKI